MSLGRDPLSDRYRYLHRDFRGTKREAQRYAAQLVTEVDHGGQQHPGKHTVVELLERWMEHLETKNRAPSTLVRNRSVIKANIAPRLGNVRIDRLGPADLDHYYATLSKSGLKPLTVRKSDAVLSATLHPGREVGLDRSQPGRPVVAAPG